MYFEADGKAIQQSLDDDGWVGGEYPVHFSIRYLDVNDVWHVSILFNNPWQQGFYYRDEDDDGPSYPYSNRVQQDVWFNYRSGNLKNLVPRPKLIGDVRVGSSGWAYHGRIDNVMLYGYLLERPYINNVKIEPSGVNVTWNGVLGAEYYEVYGGQSQTALNLATEDLIEIIYAPQTWRVDADVLLFCDEYYYVIRAVDTTENITTRSRTSNTVGYYNMTFEEGMNAFSLPLEPFSPPNLHSLMEGMGADTISWLDSNDDWQTYPSNPNTPEAEMGTGYVVEFSSPSSHVFTGEPAAMILYQEGFGFDAASRTSIDASTDVDGNVTVFWTPIPGADGYRVLKSTARNGFHTGNFAPFYATAPPFLDSGAASVPGELYYMVVPYNFTEGEGSGTYSIGVITEEYNGNDMFGLPLKPTLRVKSADWYADNIPNCLGIVYLEGGMWKAHFKEFPEGVYDTVIEMGRGYELSVFATARYAYIGW